MRRTISPALSSSTLDAGNDRTSGFSGISRPRLVVIVVDGPAIAQTLA